MTNPQKGIWSLYNSRHDQSTMGIDPMNNISNNNKNTLCSYIILIEPVILLLYVDDLFLIGEEMLITDCKKKLVVEFEMKDLGPMRYFLGIDVWQSLEKVFLNQGKYVVEILKRFDMLEYKAMNTPMETKLKLLVDTSSELVDATLYKQIIGSLMYQTNTGPGICFPVNTLSQYLAEPRRVHLVAAKHVMRFLKGTLDFGLRYTGDHDFKMVGYTNSDWVGSVSDRKSTSGCCFSLGSAMTSWKSRKQSSIALSTIEAEYIPLVVKPYGFRSC
jgi:hypothetical protein